MNKASPTSEVASVIYMYICTTHVYMVGIKKVPNIVPVQLDGRFRTIPIPFPFHFCAAAGLVRFKFISVLSLCMYVCMYVKAVPTRIMELKRAVITSAWYLMSY